jgi:hypothetical protein
MQFHSLPSESEQIAGYRIAEHRSAGLGAARNGMLAARPTRPSLEFVNPRPLQKLYAQPDPGCSCLRRGMDRGVHTDACRCPGYARSARGLRGRRPAPLRALYPGRGLHHILHDSKGALRQRRLPVGHEARHAQQPRALLEPEIRIWPTAAARAEILLANRGRPI